MHTYIHIYISQLLSDFGLLESRRYAQQAWNATFVIITTSIINMIHTLIITTATTITIIIYY